MTSIHNNIVSFLLFTFCILHVNIDQASSFVIKPLQYQKQCSSYLGVSSPDTTDASFFIENPDKQGSEDWELDCYSRPVMVDGKKLWEILLTDSNGSFRLCERLPSNKVNSRELRRVVEDAIENSEVKPNIIRFFRGAMFNMINIALSEVDVIARPSRCTFEMASWLEDRNRNYYPKMEGYRPTMSGSGRASFLDIRTAVKLPDSLRGEKYAFVSLPLAEFREDGDINDENTGIGRLCPVDPELPADAFVQGVAIFTSRANALASWLSGTELSGLRADLRKRDLVMETDIDNQFLMAKLNDVQREEAGAFEEGKDSLNGLHFVSVQVDEESDPAGFWLLREFPEGV
mmetsp:Transcript_27721/g.26540  ORF Transcript_27721/g.26540 Transcript_27721/m.26540 type:complete len:346 (-) Transcript_27721:286-1323(-)|eukprot:CAMPEP_0197833512 /NCGR_PEP_ID=MMETSP1437-20131217/19319_1 /TAXON_ID=49252 ORGANISM="Eucampia antarctica, Strain CCMP1452" /NCGR_SAMPLE_ID=MMETSP1437 /ASSEMBLY_ACC=CAM_ASM_001096 /LENGTH=345 /DNA_ID=CAMNT_0043437623 /DNA_START=40 /DNA_END=1077 /DNA_ORIENTATION=+